jgi:hypothetical protein
VLAPLFAIAALAFGVGGLYGIRQFRGRERGTLLAWSPLLSAPTSWS